ncbi:hypothetical protein [Rhodoferax aquaticus]|uniref:Uncharacterized protein n=1 Tax=Rhodoferax aquaticus TaxID=2527691 RepID=A0A515ELM8_9BURK|nr:hypothetical protein [Rhodoferax aquaticus]QDL53567.1 hypothetical protein EXZ61_04900 [Rhodoferax aquaticus]
MAHIKKFDTNWLDQAWRISSVIADMPDSPPMSLVEGVGKPPQLSDLQRTLIELLQDHIEVFLQYRSRLVHKITVTLPDGAKADIAPQSRNPVATAKTLALLQKIGVKLKDVDLWAYDAHMKLGRILIDRYVCPEWKRQLPLIVASISGETTSQTATLKAKQTRKVDRRSTLTRAVAEQRRFDPFASAAEILDRLCGGDVVREMKGGRVWYWDVKGDLKDIGLDRFETIFGEQKPSTG